MKDTSTQQLLQFINDYKLRSGKLVIFNALIFYYKNYPLIKVSSEVHVITLPHELVLYIIEFSKDEYHLPEMYSTANFDFRYGSGKALEIWNNTSLTQPLISILPLAKSEYGQT